VSCTVYWYSVLYSVPLFQSSSVGTVFWYSVLVQCLVQSLSQCSTVLVQCTGKCQSSGTVYWYSVLYSVLYSVPLSQCSTVSCTVYHCPSVVQCWYSVLVSASPVVQCTGKCQSSVIQCWYSVASNPARPSRPTFVTGSTTCSVSTASDKSWGEKAWVRG